MGSTKYLLSPSADETGMPVKRLKLSKPSMLLPHQAKSRFTELRPSHFHWRRSKRPGSANSRQGAASEVEVGLGGGHHKVPALASDGAGRVEKELEVRSGRLHHSAGQKRRLEEVEGEEDVLDLERMELKLTSKDEFLRRRTKLCGELSKFRNRIEANKIHDKIASEIGLAMTDRNNPLNVNPGKKMNRDIYADLLEYGMTKYKTSMELIFASFTDRGDGFSPSDISRFGFLLSQVICLVNQL